MMMVIKLYTWKRRKRKTKRLKAKVFLYDLFVLTLNTPSGCECV
jgi:hypothetical protein